MGSVRTLREARLEYWRRFRVIARRHRPLPNRAGWEVDKEDALLGLDLDEVLEGPERMPAAHGAAPIFVELPRLTASERADVRRRFYSDSDLCRGFDPEVRR